MTLPTLEMGEIKVLAVFEKGGFWEPEWDPLRESRIGAQFTVLDNSILSHALNGWSKPLVDALGIPPVGALKKLPLAAKQCRRRQVCPLYDPKQCFPEAAKMPWCYEPDGTSSEPFVRAAARAIEEWRQGVYVLIVTGAEYV